MRAQTGLHTDDAAWQFLERRHAGLLSREFSLDKRSEEHGERVRGAVRTLAEQVLEGAGVVSRDEIDVEQEIRSIMAEIDKKRQN